MWRRRYSVEGLAVKTLGLSGHDPEPFVAGQTAVGDALHALNEKSR
jgi:hypothetical protein